MEYDDALLVRPAIRSADALRGKTIGTPKGATTHYQLLHFLHMLQLQDEVTVRLAAPSELAALWRTGKIDGAFIWEPYLGELSRMFETRVLVSSRAVARLGAPVCETFLLRRGGLDFEIIRDVLRAVHSCNQDWQRYRWPSSSEQVHKCAYQQIMAWV